MIQIDDQDRILVELGLRLLLGKCNGHEVSEEKVNDLIRKINGQGEITVSLSGKEFYIIGRMIKTAESRCQAKEMCPITDSQCLSCSGEKADKGFTDLRKKFCVME